MEENRYDKEDFKELEDVVEKIIKKREKRKEEYVIDEHTGTFPGGERAEPKDLAKESPTPKKNKMKRVDLILALIVIAGLLIWVAWPSIISEEAEQAIVYPANVVLDSFDDGSNEYTTLRWVYPVHPPGWTNIEVHFNDYVNVSFQLRNTGDEVAKDVSCFIKCCDQNGTILFAQMFTFGDIGPDVPGKISSSLWENMRSYMVPISNETLYVTHSIEVRWLHGTNTYEKITVI